MADLPPQRAHRTPRLLAAAALAAIPALVLATGTPAQDPAADGAAAGPSGTGPAATDGGFGDPVRGQTLFAAKGCVRCHAVRGAGGRIGPDLGRKEIRGSFFEIAAAIWNHSPSMSRKMGEYRLNRPSFTGDELADLVAFLFLLNYFDEPGDPRLGKTLFAEKHCIQCHRVGHEGGSTGPALDELPRGIPPLRLAQALWNHGPAMLEAMEAQGLSVPEFASTEILDLFAFLRSTGQRLGSREFQSAGDPEHGRRLFEEEGCARCHPIFGGGGQAVGPDLGSAELRGSVTQLAGRMWNHWPGMAEAMKVLEMPIPEFQGEEMADLFAYIFIRRYQGPGGDPERGHRVYLDKRCATCHGPEGEGGAGPPLRAFTRGESKERILQRMWNHAPHMGEKIQEQRLSWPRFAGQELADLVAWLASAPSGAPERSQGALVAPR